MKTGAIPDAFCREIPELLTELESSSLGLSTAEANRRLTQFGPNRLREGEQRSLTGMVVDQYRNPMIILLLGAALVSLVIGEWQDSLVILIIVILNSVIGVVQDYRAEQALASLQKLSAPYVHAFRDGVYQQLPAEDLVPGDLVELEAGTIVAADIRLLEAHTLKMNEAALTGESVAIDKKTITLVNRDLPLGDRINMVFRGTQVTFGRGLRNCHCHGHGDRDGAGRVPA